jgi:hypothetical protein
MDCFKEQRLGGGWVLVSKQHAAAAHRFRLEAVLTACTRFPQRLIKDARMTT